MGESALYHGQHALRSCLDNNIGDFDLAFANESTARAYAVLGNDVEKQAYIHKAKEASKGSEKQEDFDYVMSELATIELN